MLEAERARGSRQILKTSVRGFKISIWTGFGLLLDLQLNTSSNFHHYYPALWQGDLPVLLTITGHNKSTCRRWHHKKKIWTEEGNWVKEQSVSLFPSSSRRDVSSGQRKMRWLTGGPSPVLYMSICFQQELTEQSESSLVCVHVQNRQQLGRLSVPPALQSKHLQRHVKTVRMHTCYISRKCDPVRRNMDIYSLN